jgi:hypothetical protein
LWDKRKVVWGVLFVGHDDCRNICFRIRSSSPFLSAGDTN